MESNYYNLFILINAALLIVNFVLLLIAAKQYQYQKCQVGELVEPAHCPDNDAGDKVGNSESPFGHIMEEPKRADVLISKITEERLLQEFGQAQASLFFLKPSISLHDVAALLGTNQRYASYIINKYVGLDFNSYVQHARVKYLLECIEHDPNLLKVKFSVLAEKAGFSSISKFSSVFKAVKGISPSEYFQRLRSR
ncbi:MAG: helix-turn-helix domain-containing protein [Sphingobacterium sp.]|jgi:AraC-like DNA-binding protein|nr:helix-turn-helix domain-containing protein [Sphingobacterium sp.]